MGNGVWPCVRLRKTHEPAKRKPKKDYELLGRGRLRHQDGAQYPYTLGPKASRAMILSTPSPPPEKTTARQNQTRQSSADDWTGHRHRRITWRGQDHAANVTERWAAVIDHGEDFRETVRRYGRNRAEGRIRCARRGAGDYFRAQERGTGALVVVAEQRAVAADVELRSDGEIVRWSFVG